MRLHKITYTQNGVKRQEFATSDGEASKRCTALKMADGVDKKPERIGVEVPTDKSDLLEWLNANATFAGDK